MNKIKPNIQKCNKTKWPHKLGISEECKGCVNPYPKSAPIPGKIGDKAYLDSDQTDFWWHIHHETLVEQLTEPVRARINYIKKDKPKDEIELRLKLLKPVLGKIPTTQRGWDALHKKECGCGWNGKTIFTKKNGLVK